MATQKRPDKKRKILWCLVLSLVVAGMLVFVSFRWSVSRRLTAQIAALESQGYPVTLEQLDAWYQLPDGADNAADAYMEAFAWCARWTPDARAPLPILGSASLPEPNVPFDPNTLALMEDYLKDNEETLNWLHKGAQIRHARYPVDFVEGAMTPIPWLSDIRHCVMLCGIQILAAIEQGQSDEFLRAWSDGMALSGSLEQMPAQIGQLVRIACVASLRSGYLERGLARLDLTDQQVLQLSNSIESSKDVNCLVRSNAGEACLVLNSIRDATLSSILDEAGQSEKASVWMVPYHFLGLMHRDLCEYLELTEVALNPRPTSFQVFLKAGHLAETRRRALPKSHRLFQTQSPVMARIGQLYTRYYAGLTSTQAALAVLRYRLKYQKLPDTLAALVPEYMAAVPVDPFDGKPMRYVTQANGFMVYSVDEDGQDNGGRKRAPKNGDKPYDLVFSVQSQD